MVHDAKYNRTDVLFRHRNTGMIRKHIGLYVFFLSFFAITISQGNIHDRVDLNQMDLFVFMVGIITIGFFLALGLYVTHLYQEFGSLSELFSRLKG